MPSPTIVTTRTQHPHPAGLAFTPFFEMLILPLPRLPMRTLVGLPHLPVLTLKPLPLRFAMTCPWGMSGTPIGCHRTSLLHPVAGHALGVDNVSAGLICSQGCLSNLCHHRDPEYGPRHLARQVTWYAPCVGKDASTDVGFAVLPCNYRNLMKSIASESPLRYRKAISGRSLAVANVNVVSSNLITRFPVSNTKTTLRAGFFRRYFSLD